MSLHANAVDADAFFLQKLGHSHNASDLLGSPGIEVVVVQFRVGSVLRGELERVAHQFVPITDGGDPRSWAIGTVIVDHFVDDIPCVYSARVTTGNRFDMPAHPFDLLLRCIRFTVFVGKEPIGGLIVPHERVADDEHFIGFPESDDRIRFIESVNAGSRIDRSRLHGVFRSDRVELIHDDTSGNWV